MYRVIGLVLLLVQASWAWADGPEPCLRAKAACTEWVTLDQQGQRGLIYRTHALTQRNTAIEHAVIVIHGQGRNADGYFRHGLAGAFLADALQTTLLLSPRFASNEGKDCRDKLDTKEVGWVCLGPESWRNGGEQEVSILRVKNVLARGKGRESGGRVGEAKCVRVQKRRARGRVESGGRVCVRERS